MWNQACPRGPMVVVTPDADGAGSRGASRLLDAAIASTLENGNTSDLDAAALLPPKYVDFKEQIRTEMFSIKQKMNELRQLHGKV